MRTFLIVFTTALALTVSISAQTPLTVRAFEKGTRAARAKNYETAIEDYRRALLFSETEKTSDALLAGIHFNLGVCLYNTKQAAEAVGEYTEAIRLSRRNYQKAFYALGMAESELKNWRQAEDAFREAVALKPDDGEAWFDLGLILLERENYKAAENAFQKAIKYESVATADAHNNLGVIFALKSDFQTAEMEFRTALAKSNDKSIEARNNLEFCRLYRLNFNQNLLAKFELSRCRKNETAD